jgi:hypothetical protein
MANDQTPTPLAELEGNPCRRQARLGQGSSGVVTEVRRPFGHHRWELVRYLIDRSLSAIAARANFSLAEPVGSGDPDTGDRMGGSSSRGRSVPL